jgi:hypothetical protein
MAEIFRTGYVGGAVPEAIDWMVEQSEGAKTICVPFAGIGRSIVAMARPDTTIESFDTQHYTKCIFEGVFRAKEAETNVDGIHYRKGWAFENRPYKNLDDRCAGFMDWVAQEGTLYDKACLGSAITRSTLMARMMHWKSNVEQFYNRFQKQFEYNKDWLNQPGKFVHHEDNFFNWSVATDLITETGVGFSYDFIEIDPPKVVNYSDTYSLRFEGFNQILTQGVAAKLPKWNRRNAMGYMRKALETPAPKVVFMYVSGVFPPYEDVKKMLATTGTIEEEREFFHQGRTDYGLVIAR